MLVLFAVAVAAIAVAFLLLRFLFPAPCALGCAVLASFWFPSFWVVRIFGEPISVQTGVAVVSLVLFLLTGGSLRLRITAGDIAIGFVFLVHCVSDGLVHHQGWPAVVVAYGEWVLPYAAGRYAFGTAGSFSSARWILGGFLLTAFLVWQVDLWFNINVIHSFSQDYGQWEPTRRASRFSWTRSAGMTEHPIFFSGLLMALCPVVVLAFQNRQRADVVKRFFLITFGLILVSVTLSRAAVIALVMTLLGMVALEYRRLRWPLLVAVGGLVLIGLLVPQWVETVWMKTGGSSDLRRRVLTIDGQEQLHSSTLARVRVFDVYGRAALRAGMFGYGTAAVREFPPNLPFLPQETNAVDTVWTVENSYLLIILRFGWVGLAALTCLVLAPLLQVALTSSLNVRRERAVMAMGLTSIAILLATVHSSYEIMFPYLWVMGLLNGLVDPKIGK